MIMQLVEEEKLSLDGKLSKFFPDLANADQITIRQLLGHQSGIGSITDDPTYGDWKNAPKTRDQMIEIISRQPTQFEPAQDRVQQLQLCVVGVHHRGAFQSLVR